MCKNNGVYVDIRRCVSGRDMVHRAKKNDMAGMQFDIENEREGKLWKYQADPRGEQGQEIRQERGSLLSEIISREKEKGECMQDSCWSGRAS